MTHQAESAVPVSDAIAKDNSQARRFHLSEHDCRRVPNDGQGSSEGTQNG